MKKLVFLCILLPNLIFSQRKGVVVNENKQALFYANIWCLDGSAGATTDVSGAFEIVSASKDESLVVSLPGYKNLYVNGTTNDTLVMETNPILIKDDLFVLPEKTLRHTIGDAHFENFFFSPGNVPTIYVKYFGVEKQFQNLNFLDKVILYTRSDVANATFKLRVLKVGSDGKPADDLITKPIVVAVKRGNKKNTIDLLPFYTKMPKEGVFIGIEWILSENNKSKMATFQKGEAFFVDYKYAPDLMNNQVKTSKAFRYISGKWKSNTELLKNKKESDLKLYIDPAINLILTN